MNLSTIPSCITSSIFELHTQSIINFTQFDFIKDKHSLPVYEIVLKIILCLISLLASLLGNLIVMGSILAKSINSAYSPKLTNGPKYESRFIRQEKDYFVSINTNGDRILKKNRKSLSQEADRGNLFSNRAYKLYKSKSVNLFILNLCFCDLMIVVWCSWVHMINSISQNWVFGAFFCKFNTFVQGKDLII